MNVELPLVASVTVMSVQSTVIGGRHDGENVAVTEREKSALPFWTGNVPSVETDSLFTAFGWLLLRSVTHPAEG
jgi:hypothetical protein